MVSYLTYLVIFTPDKTLLTFWLSLTYLFHVYTQSLNSNKFHGSTHIWATAHLRGNLQAPHLASPPGICLLSAFNSYIPPSFTDITLCQNMPSLQKKWTGGKRHGFLVGEPHHLPPASLTRTPLSFPSTILFSISILKIWGTYRNPTMTLLTCWFG